MDKLPIAPQLPSLQNVQSNNKEVTITVVYYDGNTRKHNKEVIINVDHLNHDVIVSKVNTAFKYAEDGFNTEYGK